MGTYAEDRRDAFAFLGASELPAPKTVSLLTGRDGRHGDVRLPDDDVRAVDEWLAHFGVEARVTTIPDVTSWVMYGADDDVPVGVFLVSVWSCVHTEQPEVPDA